MLSSCPPWSFTVYAPNCNFVESSARLSRILLNRDWNLRKGFLWKLKPLNLICYQATNGKFTLLTKLEIQNKKIFRFLYFFLEIKFWTKFILCDIRCIENICRLLPEAFSNRSLSFDESVASVNWIFWQTCY